MHGRLGAGGRGLAHGRAAGVAGGDRPGPRGRRLGETRTQTRAFVDTYAVRLPFALADVRLQEGETTDARLASFEEVERAVLEGAPWLAGPVRERMLPLLPKLRAFRDRQ